MCSNFAGVGNIGSGDHDQDHENSSSRKAKKQRIPKRGPGVAELEKILREQEMIKKDGIIGGISSTLVPSIPNTDYHISSNSLPINVTNFLPPAVTTTFNVNGNGDHLKGSGNGRSKGVYIGGSGVFLPEQTLLPTTWGSSETRKGDKTPKTAAPADHFSFPILFSNGSDHSKNFPPPMLLQNNHPSMMNLFPVSSMSSTPSSSPSAGVYHRVEPPSNQKTCRHNYASTLLPEEDKMMGTKRPRPNFPVVENWPFAHPHMACRKPPPNFQPHISRLDPSLPKSSNRGVFNLGTPSRDPMQVKTCVNNDHVNPNGNVDNALIKLGSPTTPLPLTQSCQPDNMSKFIKQFPFQENTEGLLQRSSSGISVPNQSFFSLLLAPKEQKGPADHEATLGLKNERYCTEKTGDFIDLNLKL